MSRDAIGSLSKKQMISVLMQKEARISALEQKCKLLEFVARVNADTIASIVNDRRPIDEEK